MKKKWIAAFIAAGVLLLGGVTVYAVKTSSQSTVKVVSVSDMSGGGGWSDNSLSGNITSDVSQNIYLADSQKVKKIYVKEGDTVKVGDDLLTYDMTLENLDLEMKKLEKQGIELNIEKANREITKLKNTKPPVITAMKIRDWIYRKIRARNRKIRPWSRKSRQRLIRSLQRRQNRIWERERWKNRIIFCVLLTVRFWEVF